MIWAFFTRVVETGAQLNVKCPSVWDQCMYNAVAEILCVKLTHHMDIARHRQQTCLGHGKKARLHQFNLKEFNSGSVHSVELRDQFKLNSLAKNWYWVADRVDMFGCDFLQSALARTAVSADSVATLPSNFVPIKIPLGILWVESNLRDFILQS